MTRRIAHAAAVAAALLLAAVPSVGAASVKVSVDRSVIATKLGRAFVLRSKIANHGTTAATGLIAHLNVLSLRSGLYVDPEDWSSHRTRYLPPIPAGGSTTLTWKLSAVNAGTLGVYVVVLPQSGAPVPPAIGPTTHVVIADRRTLDSSGILPLAFGIPALLGVGILLLRLWRARSPGRFGWDRDRVAR